MRYFIDKRLLIIFLLFTIISSSCSKKDVKKTPEEGINARNAINFVERLKSVYMNKDESSLEPFVESTDVLAKYFSFSTKPIKLDFTPRWVEIEGSRIDVYISWKGIYPVNQKEVELRGFALFVLSKEDSGKDSFVLKKILRENPFKM